MSPLWKDWHRCTQYIASCPLQICAEGREQAKENRKYSHKAIKGGDQKQTRALDRLRGFHLYYLAGKHHNHLTMKCTYPIYSGLGKQGKSGAWNCQLPMSLIIWPTLISHFGTAPNNRVAVALIRQATFLTFFANFSFRELLKYGIPE